jgi:zinc protease
MHPADPAALASPVRQVHLDNGLTVLVFPVHTAPLVSVWSWYRVGSGDEMPGRTGASHWVEHMNFKGTEKIPGDEMKGLVERLGGMWNGYTWIDQTTYLETAGAAALDQLLFVEAERMAHGLYDPHEVESERTVIISELQGGDNDPEQLLDTEVTASAFRAHPYRHPTIGWLDDLRSMTRDDLYRHYREFYVPNNATLVVVGDVEPEDVIRRVECYFGAIAEGPEPRRVTTVEPAQIGERRVIVERPGTTSYLKFAWHAPAVTDPDFYPMLVLDAALTGAKGLNLWASYPGGAPQRKARLYTKLVDTGLASSVSGALLPTARPFLYTISFTATDGVDLDALEAAASDAMEQVRRRGIAARDVARARKQLRARLLIENDSVTNLAHQLGYFSTVAGPDFFAGLPAGIEAVTPEQVSDVAARRLTRTTRTVGRFCPSPDQP